MSDQKKILIAAALVALALIGAGFAVMSYKSAPGDSAAPVTEDQVTLEEGRAVITFEDGDVVIPAPAGYCFADPDEKIDRELIQVMDNMQQAYGNKLWLTYANCEQLKAVRHSGNLTTYIDTGMLVTPLHFRAANAEQITTGMRAQLDALDPVTFKDLVNDAAHANMSKTLAIESGKPVIYHEEKTALMFLLQHELNDPSTGKLQLTELDIVTALHDHAFVAIFTYKDVADVTPHQAFTKDYLAQLRAANVPAHIDEPDFGGQ